VAETFVGKVNNIARSVAQNVGRVIVGKEAVVELALVALLSNGHLLIEDIPGVGKTMLAKSLARSLGCTFRRIQCTPDLLPADITGSSVFNQKRFDFEFKPGPIITQVLLVDEINRATPRTQSALLEAMEERQVTTEQGTVLLPRPFLVLATQNPVELEGTFLLPEAQLDRFMLKVDIGYPAVEEDRAILDRFNKGNPLERLESVASGEEILESQSLCRDVEVSLAVRDYIIELIRATRRHPKIELGASPRAMLNLFHASQSLAALRGRSYVLPDDVKYLVPHILGHRLITGLESSLKGAKVSDLCGEIIEAVAVPVEDPEEASW
jgi:MoxR-like ATPase